MRLSLRTQEILAAEEDLKLEHWQMLHRYEFELEYAGFADDEWVPSHLGVIEDEILPSEEKYGKQPATHRRAYSLDEARALGIRWDDSDPDDSPGRRLRSHEAMKRAGHEALMDAIAKNGKYE